MGSPVHCEYSACIMVGSTGSPAGRPGADGDISIVEIFPLSVPGDWRDGLAFDSTDFFFGSSDFTLIIPALLLQAA